MSLPPLLSGMSIIDYLSDVPLFTLRSTCCGISGDCKGGVIDTGDGSIRVLKPCTEFDAEIATYSVPDRRFVI